MPDQQSDTGSHVVADQSDVFAALGRPATHGMRGRVTRIDTHGAAVFLAGDDVYKVKRAVRFPFMDYSTLARRRSAAKAEIEVNRRNAPGIYLGVVPITRSNGKIAIGGPGKVIEWAVHMRRFDENDTLDHVATREGGLTPALVARLAEAVLAAHRRAPRRQGPPAVAALATFIEQNREAFAEFPDLFPAGERAPLSRASRIRLEKVRPLLLKRGREGLVRRCHGDLHLGNIVLIKGEPVLFDAIEFDETVATCDLLYDLAFLLMDLIERGHAAEANALLNRYLWGRPEGELSGLSALPLFLSLRAAIRAKVTAARLPLLAGARRRNATRQARGYFERAQDFLKPSPPRFVAIGGLSGTGKSTLAAALAPEIGAAPGAVHLRSDIERKRMLGAAETETLPQSAYSQETTAKVYRRLRALAKAAIRAGMSVVVDAVHARPAERRAIAAVARSANVPFIGIWLDAPADRLIARVETRRGDASDADARVVRGQLGYALGAIEWARIESSGSPRTVLRRARRIVAMPKTDGGKR